MDTYEKKYKDALDAMRMFIYPKLCGDAKLAAENVFPELRESEDERIRKMLIRYFKELKVDSFINLEIPSILAWLEKQKEIDVLDEEEREFADNIDSVRQLVDDAYQKGLEEGRKEQKPSITSKFNVGDRIHYKGNGCNQYVIKEVCEDYYMNDFDQRMDMSYTDANFELLNHLDDVPLVAPSKPVWWSKEDKKVLDDCIKLKEVTDEYESFEDGDATGWRRKEQKPTESVNLEEIAKMIKNEAELFRNLLKKKGIDYQPEDVYWKDYARMFVSSAKKLFGEQKPVEWSEEDEEKLERVDDLLWMLDDYLGDDCSICEERTTRLREEIKNVLCPFLKSLRPHWKPNIDGIERMLVYDPIPGTTIEEAARQAIIVAKGEKERIILWFNSRFIVVEPDDTKEFVMRRYISNWKPSEEQIQILEMVLTDEAMDDNVHSVLESLLKQLKAL